MGSAAYQDFELTLPTPRRRIDRVRLARDGPPEVILAASRVVLENSKEHPGFLLGFGVVAYDCDPSRVHSLREMLEVLPC